MKKIIIAIDSFKGSLSSMEVSNATEKALLYVNKDIQIRKLYISDGGEEFATAVTQAMGGKLIEIDGHDALMRPITTHFGDIGHQTAVMDVSSTIGITRLSINELNPLKATSYGAGEMMRTIILRGYRHLIIGLGGSATNDCGRGLIKALEGVSNLNCCTFTIASDVDNPLCGPQGAAYTFAPQKGATVEMLPLLEAENLRFGQELEAQCGHNIIDQPGAGAAGGIGAALMSLSHCHMESGINLLLQLYNFDTLLQQADLVITGEGKIDHQSFQGKAPFGIALQALKTGVPCIALCGKKSHDILPYPHSPWTHIIPVTPDFQPLSKAIQRETALVNITNAIMQNSHLFQ